jgi:hypothetical protein
MELRKVVEETLSRSAYVKLLLLQRQAGVVEAMGRGLAKALKAGRTFSATAAAPPTRSTSPPSWRRASSASAARFPAWR